MNLLRRYPNTTAHIALFSILTILALVGAVRLF